MELFSTGVNHGSRRKHNKGRIPGIGETNWSETVQSIAVDNEAIVALFLKNIRIHSFSRLESQESVNLCWAHLQLLIIVTFHSAIPCTSTPVLTLPTMMSFKEQTQNPAFILPKKKKKHPRDQLVWSNLDRYMNKILVTIQDKVAYLGRQDPEQELLQDPTGRSHCFD